MKNYRMIIPVLLIALSFLVVVPKEACFAEDDIVITIDAGHGGRDAGAARKVGKKYYYEKNMNLQIAKALKTELETYDGVTVYMTRTGDTSLSLKKRLDIAEYHESDLLISIHNNAIGKAQKYARGSSVLIANGNYRKRLANIEREIGTEILTALSENPGTKNCGFLLRSSTKQRYANGKRADYYAIVRGGVLRNFPSIIVEHAFVDNATDFKAFLSSQSKLKKLGIADAKGIANYYGLEKHSEPNPEGTENTEGTESTESTENIENTENTENTEIKESMESTPNTEGTENVDNTTALTQEKENK